MQDYLLPADNIFGYDVGYGRPYGIFQQPNVLASFMATTLIVSGYLLQKINNKKQQLFLLLTITLNIWVITVAMSRTGYLGVLIAFLLLMPWAWKRNKKRLGLFLFAIFIGIGFGLLRGDALGARNIESMKEGGARLGHYAHSWQMIKQKPLMGYGYGSFEKEYLISHAARVKKGELPAEAAHLTHPHNDLLFWAVEGGIVPIIALLILVIAFLRLLRAFNLLHALALLALVVPIAVHTQTEYPLYHSALHWLVLIVLVFYIDDNAEKREEIPFQLTFALRIFAVLIPLLTALFMISNLVALSKITEYERSKQPDINLLLGITNPLVFQDRFEFHLNYFRLMLAIKMNKPEEIQKVINQTEESLKSLPRSYLYALLYLAYMNNQQQEKAKALLDYAQYLYPFDKQLAAFISSSVKSESR
jgi:O-antigen polymerase